MTLPPCRPRDLTSEIDRRLESSDAALRDDAEIRRVMRMSTSPGKARGGRPTRRAVTDIGRSHLAAEIDDAIVAALVAAIVASFREAAATDGSRRGTDRNLMVAS
jgi:hypothetical protein